MATSKMLTAAEVEEGLSSRSPGERWKWVRNLDFTPTPAQIERGMRDDHWRIRYGWGTRGDFTPTSAQAVRGLTDADHEVRLMWCQRTDLSLSSIELSRIVMKLEKKGFDPLPPALEMRLRAQAESKILSVLVKKSVAGVKSAPEPRAAL